MKQRVLRQHEIGTYNGKKCILEVDLANIRSYQLGHTALDGNKLILNMAIMAESARPSFTIVDGVQKGITGKSGLCTSLTVTLADLEAVTVRELLESLAQHTDARLIAGQFRLMHGDAELTSGMTMGDVTLKDGDTVQLWRKIKVVVEGAGVSVDYMAERGLYEPLRPIIAAFEAKGGKLTGDLNRDQTLGEFNNNMTFTPDETRITIKAC